VRELLTFGLVLTGALVVLGLLWRLASRLLAMPCPAWLVPLLENPYMRTVAGAEMLLDRAGIAEGMSVLDVGCGPGRLTLPAAERVGPTGRVVALDLQSAMLGRLRERLTRRKLENVRAMLAGAGEGKVERGAFDRALLVTVLGEIRDKGRALDEIREALRPAGILSVTEVLPDPHYQSRRRVRELAERAGFVVNEEWAGAVAFTVNLQRRG
jgi:ubiquinone/menaquinone biosynthesis C-methylase UbiE